MNVIEELRTELEDKLDIQTVITDIATRLDLDMKSMLRTQSRFSEDVNFYGGFDLTGQLMVELRLIRTTRSSFNPGTYSYTQKAGDLYTRLKEERYYDP